MTRSIIVIHRKKDVPTQNGKVNRIFPYPRSILINISLHTDDINCFLIISITNKISYIPYYFVKTFQHVILVLKTSITVTHEEKNVQTVIGKLLGCLSLYIRLKQIVRF